MPDLRLSMASGSYDHVRDLLSGCVRADGIELIAMELPIEEIFFRTFSFREWDISEFSMAKYASLVGSGNAPFTAIPVFPSRVFRQSAIYVAAASGIRAPEDLRGKRIGVPEWAQTAGIYARAYLQHQCKLRLAEIDWVQGGVNQAGRHEKVSPRLPEGVSIRAVHDRSLNDMLLDGDLDAIVSAREPAAFIAGDPRIARLWTEYRGIEEAYYRETGIFPIMHVVVVRNQVLESAPWVAGNLLRAFEQAKANSQQRLSTIVNSPVPVPWIHDAYERCQRLFGEDPWPYGIDANRTTLATFLQYCQEQGITDRRVSVDELFPLQLTQSFRV